MGRSGEAWQLFRPSDCANRLGRRCAGRPNDGLERWTASGAATTASPTDELAAAADEETAYPLPPPSCF